MIPIIKNIKKAILQAENPIGHIRMETTDVNPATYLGFGTWVLWGAGRVPVGVDTADDDFKTAEKTGGEKTHRLTEPEMPKHWHKTAIDFGGTETLDNYSGYGNNNTSRYYNNTSTAGGNQPHNNLQPYITCYMWKRVS